MAETIIFLGNRSSIHLIRWMNAIADLRTVDGERCYSVHCVSMERSNEGTHAEIEYHTLPFKKPLGYYLNALHVRKLIRSIKPALLHAHYASGYGTLARLAGFHLGESTRYRHRPALLLSAWGSDVFLVPCRSKREMKTVTKNLLAADCLGATSFAIRNQIVKLIGNSARIEITPFGIETAVFKPQPLEKERNKIRLVTVKALRSTAGIDTLLKTVALLLAEGVSVNSAKIQIELTIYGEGEMRAKLEQFARELKIQDVVTFAGAVPHAELPALLPQFDIFLLLSKSESFGVAALEAAACGLPVIGSEVGGIPEVIVDGKTGFLVPEGDEKAAADKVRLLIENPQLRCEMGDAGRAFVCSTYSWEMSVQKMSEVYNSIIKKL